MSQHTPVMVKEVLQHLLHSESQVIVDGTIGAGGHAHAILSARQDIRLIGLDRDPTALALAADALASLSGRVRLVQAEFSNLRKAIAPDQTVDGILLDLGVSSMQIDKADRGFSHSRSGPLDMRMSDTGETAQELIARLSLEELAGLIKSFGEVRRSYRISRAIKEAAAESEMESTSDLRNAVVAALGGSIAPGVLSQVFQSLRIAVNDELGELDRFLGSALMCLNDGGRLVIISYHSLEDRRVKQFMRNESAACICPPEVPICVCSREVQLRVLTRRVVTADESEIKSNVRSRSAKLRAAEFVETEAIH